jgi:hypothetical protein
MRIRSANCFLSCATKPYSESMEGNFRFKLFLELLSLI